MQGQTMCLYIMVLINYCVGFCCVYSDENNGSLFVIGKILYGQNVLSSRQTMFNNINTSKITCKNVNVLGNFYVLETNE